MINMEKTKVSHHVVQLAIKQKQQIKSHEDANRPYKTSACEEFNVFSMLIVEPMLIL